MQSVNNIDFAVDAIFVFVDCEEKFILKFYTFAGSNNKTTTTTTRIEQQLDSI